MSEEAAIKATVSGNDEQVGFRALIMKQAIRYNLAGSAENEANQIVHFTLQGDEQRIDSAIDIIRPGTKRSSNITVTPTPAIVDPALNAFTIVDWTSLSRSITNKYNLVFKLRDDDTEISPDQTKAAWRSNSRKHPQPRRSEKVTPGRLIKVRPIGR